MIPVIDTLLAVKEVLVHKDTEFLRLKHVVQERLDQ